MKKGDWIGHVLRKNFLLNHITAENKGREDEEEDVISYWMTFCKRK
jgi:hypothetical protein